MISEEESFSESSHANEDSEFSGSEVRARPARQTRRQINISKEDIPKRTLRPRKEFNVVVDENSDDNSSVHEFEVKQKIVNVLNPPVVSIHSRRTEAGKTLYFVRHQNNSFHQCKWVEEIELLRLDPALKPKLKRFDNAFNSDPNSYLEMHMINYDPQNYEVDRIVDCSEVFSLIHPKKSGEIKNKWSENLLRVMRSIASFSHDEVKYGAFYIDLAPLYAEYPNIENQVDVSVLINRVYLDHYGAASNFWNDLGVMFKNIETICENLDKRSDLWEMNQRMKYVASCLYEDWFQVSTFQKDCLERFKILWLRETSFEDFKTKIKQIVKEYEEGVILLKDLVALIQTVYAEYNGVVGFKLDEADRFGEETAELIEKIQHIISSNSEVLQIDTIRSNLLIGNSNAQICQPTTKAAANQADQLEIEEIMDSGKPLHELSNNNDTKETENDQNNKDSDNDTHNNNSYENIPPSLIIPNELASTQLSQLKELFESFMNKLKTRLFHFEVLNERSSNAEFLKFFASLEKSLDWLKTQDLQISIDNNWIATTDPRLKIQTNSPILYKVKWCNLSYNELTWEKETDISDFDNIIKNYRRHTRTVDRETRKNYLFKLQKFIELREIYENPKKLGKTSPAYISDLKRKIFTYKDQKNVIQYCAKTQPIFRDGRILRSYQLESLNWMIEAWTKRRNVILADEMGLGKTIQAMSFLNHLIVIEQAPGPYLVIAPLSTLAHWKRVFEDWTHLNTLLYYDIDGKNGREICGQSEFYHWDITMKGIIIKNNKIPKFQVMITSFEVFIQDFDTVFMDIPFQHIIIDEAHRLKNKNAKIICILRRLVCKRILLLTGTPIQNNISELWSLLNFIEPNAFNDVEFFQSEFGDQMKVENLQKLKQLLEPYLLRRMKDEVESSIPPLTETIIDVELTHVQKIMYKTLYEKNKGTLQKGLGMNCISIMNNLEMQLRKCCNHPFLLNEIKQDIIKDCDTYDKYYDKLIISSGKMIFLDKALEKFKKEGKKVLVFSQFTEMLKVIEEYLHFKAIRYQKIDGTTKAKDRQVAIDRFNKNQGCFEVFLLSTKAGGLGINLTSASIVIIYDSDWNPQNDVQAIARAHRIGQTEEVKVFRLISKKTYESEMFERASKKLGLDQAILLANSYSGKNHDVKNNEEITKLKPEEIEILLRKGMVGLLNVEEQEGQEQFTQNVDDIIQNARVANYSIVNGTYSFNKTRFMGNEKEAMVQIDDPDFWKKVFLDQKSAAENLEKEYRALFVNDKSVSIDNQKTFFLKLSSEIYQYLEDRVKNEAFSADTEFKFGELLNSLINNTKLNQGLKELVVQLHQDFVKKSRRIKRIDEKTVNQMLKVATNSSAANKRRARDNDEPITIIPIKEKEVRVEKTKAKEEIAIKEPKLAKREKIKETKEENDVFSESSEEVFKVKKKAKKEEKIKYCDLCGKSKPDVTCQGACKKSLHLACLENQVRACTSDKNGAMTNEDSIHYCSSDNSPSKITRETDKSFINSLCYFCCNNIAECFLCKRIGPITNEKESNQMENYPNNVIKCSVCPKFYHFKCLPSKSRGAKNAIRCYHHYCVDCDEYSRSLYKCLFCTVSFHSKCMSKKHKVVEGNSIICSKHQNTSKSATQKSSEDHNKSYEKMLKNKKSSLIKTLNPEPPKASNAIQNPVKSKRVKESTNFYEKLNIKPPHEFDFANYKQVSLLAMVSILRSTIL